MAARPEKPHIRGPLDGPMQVRSEAFGLVALSILDLFMTYALLRRGPHFVESNPVARWWFERWNVAGLTAFKFVMFATVIAIAEYVERRRPGTGRKLLWAACLVTAAVVLYSARLSFAT